MERALYNGVLSGVSLDGRRFFYANPLEVDPKRYEHRPDLFHRSSVSPTRQEWFGCACCPPNIARLTASIGAYVYSQSDQDIYVHLYIQGTGTASVGNRDVVLRQETDYPWDGNVRISVDPQSAATFGLNLRIPGWSRSAKLSVNGQEVEVEPITDMGYACVRREWKAGDVVELQFPMPVERIHAHPAVKEDTGLVALQRGPIVYCLEQADNPVPLNRIVLPPHTEFKAEFKPDVLNGVVVIEADALLIDDSDWEKSLYRAGAVKAKPFRITAIPYYAWDHRQPGEMRVWIRGCLP